jgi:hypothetical protein
VVLLVLVLMLLLLLLLLLLLVLMLLVVVGGRYPVAWYGGTYILGPSLPTADRLVARLVDWALYYHYYQSKCAESRVLDAMWYLSRSLPARHCCFDSASIAPNVGLAVHVAQQRLLLHLW